jgi:hypothetical protein
MAARASLTLRAAETGVSIRRKGAPTALGAAGKLRGVVARGALRLVAFALGIVVGSLVSGLLPVDRF